MRLATVVAVGPKFTRIALGGDGGRERRVRNTLVELDARASDAAAYGYDSRDVPLPYHRFTYRRRWLPRWSWLGWTIAQHLEYAAGSRPLEREPDPSPARLVIVGCGGKKADKKHSDAHSIYVGSYFKAARRAADALMRSNTEQIILSAKYGILDLHDVIEPYDLRLGQPGSVSVDTVRYQAWHLGLAEAPEVIVLAGRTYADVVSAVWPHAIRPLDGATGIGEQLQRLAAIAATRTIASCGPVNDTVPRPCVRPNASPTDLYPVRLKAGDVVEITDRGQLTVVGTDIASSATPTVFRIAVEEGDPFDIDAGQKVTVIRRAGDPHVRGTVRLPHDVQGLGPEGTVVPAWVCCACSGVELTELALWINHGCCRTTGYPRCDLVQPSKTLNAHWVPPERGEPKRARPGRPGEVEAVTAGTIIRCGERDCGRRARIRKDGKIGSHRRRGGVKCPMSGRPIPPGWKPLSGEGPSDVRRAKQPACEREEADDVRNEVEALAKPGDVVALTPACTGLYGTVTGRQVLSPGSTEVAKTVTVTGRIDQVHYFANGPAGHTLNVWVVRHHDKRMIKPLWMPTKGATMRVQDPTVVAEGEGRPKQALAPCATCGRAAAVDAMVAKQVRCTHCGGGRREPRAHEPDWRHPACRGNAGLDEYDDRVALNALGSPDGMAQAYPDPGDHDLYEQMVRNGLLVDRLGRALRWEDCPWCEGHRTSGSACPVQVSCPTCAAGPERPCTDPSRHGAPDPHKARWEAATADDDVRASAGDLSVPAPWPRLNPELVNVDSVYVRLLLESQNRDLGRQGRANARAAAERYALGQPFVRYHRRPSAGWSYTCPVPRCGVASEGHVDIRDVRAHWLQHAHTHSGFAATWADDTLPEQAEQQEQPVRLPPLPRREPAVVPTVIEVFSPPAQATQWPDVVTHRYLPSARWPDGVTVAQIRTPWNPRKAEEYAQLLCYLYDLDPDRIRVWRQAAAPEPDGLNNLPPLRSPAAGAPAARMGFFDVPARQRWWQAAIALWSAAGVCQHTERPGDTADVVLHADLDATTARSYMAEICRRSGHPASSTRLGLPNATTSRCVPRPARQSTARGLRDEVAAAAAAPVRYLAEFVAAIDATHSPITHR